jgi:hypothetical protein
MGACSTLQKINAGTERNCVSGREPTGMKREGGGGKEKDDKGKRRTGSRWTELQTQTHGCVGLGFELALFPITAEQ